MPFGLNEKEFSIAKELEQVNLLITYSLAPPQIADWAKCIVELEPDIDNYELKSVIDKYKRGIYEWDQREGIQNIFRGIFKHNNPQL